MTATVLDTVTGEKKEVEGVSSYHWAEGNWSCDCNRNAFGVEMPDTGFCIGGSRFVVVDAKFEPDEAVYTLAELNEEYPPELLAAHGITPEHPNV